MRVKIRKTISGVEYWDTEEKLTIFVPNGKEPDFEVTHEPKSLVEKKAVKVIKEEIFIEPDIEDYSEDKSENDMLPKSQEDDIDQLLADEEESSDEVDISSMTIKALKEYAQDHNMEIPKEVTRRDDILEFISNTEMERELIEE